MNTWQYKYATQIVTLFGLGFWGRMPGTNGSIVALPTTYFIMTYLGFWYLMAILVGVYIVAIWAINIVESQQKSHDDGAIIIDEWVAQSLLLAFAPLQLQFYLLGLLIFRLLDIFKPFPISWFDKNIGGAMGVMVDDLVAAGLAVPLMVFLKLYF